MTDSNIHDPGISGYIKITPEILTNDYMSEIRELAFATSQDGFNDCLERFQNYSNHLRRIRKKVKFPLKAILDASNGTRIVDTTTKSDFIWDALITAHIASCCELFKGSRLKRKEFTADSLYAMGQQFISTYKTACKEDILKVMDKLHSMDTVRTMHQLRLLGLISQKTSAIRQLALGAGTGAKDMFKLHSSPEINKNNLSGDDIYEFQITQEFIEHIIITDLDESRNELYASYSETSNPPAYAACADMMEFLTNLPNKNFKNRNLVTAIRIDHRMLPDVPAFLGLLSNSIDEQCNFIMSMGAGNSIEEFEGRVNKLAEIFSALEQADLQPVLLKLHGPGTLAEQHASLRFGNPSSSTFQVLYCNLQRKKLYKKYAAK